MITVNKNLAQQIVETVKDVCGYNINFIDMQGIIFASTDSSRIGDYHEIGHKVAVSGSSIEVTEDNSFEGTNKGVNIPIFHQGNVVAVIGISGEPDKVRKFAVLAEKITRLLIREQELNASIRSRAERRSYVAKSLLYKNIQNLEYLKDCLSDMQIDMEQPKRVITIHISKKYNVANISMIEAEILQLFSHIDITLYTYQYPKEYIGILEDKIYQTNYYLLQKFADNYKKILKIGIGDAKDLFHLDESYEASETALKSMGFESSKNIVVFDDLTLEIIISQMGDKKKEEYMNKILSKLTEEEIQLLTMYYQYEQSLQKTSEALFIHKNTLQKRLDRIQNTTGYNPRQFQNGVVLYLACILWAEKKKKSEDIRIL